MLINLHVFILIHLDFCTSCVHVSVIKSVYECGYLSGCVSLRPESKASHLGTALERRVIDNYRPRLLPNHRFGSGRQTACTPVCLPFSPCTHGFTDTHIYTPSECASQSSLPGHARVNTHTWYIALQRQLNAALSNELSYSESCTALDIDLLFLILQPNILSHTHTCNDFKSSHSKTTFSQLQCKFLKHLVIWEHVELWMTGQVIKN